MKSATTHGLTRFGGNEGEFTMWKHKVLTHICQLDQEYQRHLLEKGQPDATVLMVHFLEGSPEEPVMSVSQSTRSLEESLKARWHYAHWVRAKSAMQSLINQALPNAFL